VSKHSSSRYQRKFIIVLAHSRIIVWIIICEAHCKFKKDYQWHQEMDKSIAIPKSHDPIVTRHIDHQTLYKPDTLQIPPTKI
jgi:hypothetical protein